MSGHFIVKSKLKLADLPLNHRIEQSDFASLTNDGTFVQLEYVEEEEKIENYKIKPGVFTITTEMGKLKLQSTSFTSDKILKTNKYVEDITGQINKFFAKKDAYRKYGFEVPKRAWLLWGTAGAGKTSVIKELTDIYKTRSDTTIILWPSDKIDAGEVKHLVKRFEYSSGIEKLILIIEDLGGVEIDQVRIKSMSSLLSLLDNVEKTFSIPTAIIATTNFPENFLGNITNRPQRFDTKIEIQPPNGEERAEFLKFFSNNTAPEDALEELRKKIYKNITPAHIKEILMRAELNDITMLNSLKQIQKEIDIYEKMFQTNKSKVGIGSQGSNWDD
jgi:ATP-dependent 26S proteasome regulatory subunit